MSDTAHNVYAATVRQVTGLVAERDALVLALAAKQQQVDALLEERELLRAAVVDALSGETEGL